MLRHHPNAEPQFHLLYNPGHWRVSIGLPASSRLRTCRLAAVTTARAGDSLRRPWTFQEKALAVPDQRWKPDARIRAAPWPSRRYPLAPGYRGLQRHEPGVYTSMYPSDPYNIPALIRQA